MLGTGWMQLGNLLASYLTPASIAAYHQLCGHDVLEEALVAVPHVPRSRAN